MSWEYKTIEGPDPESFYTRTVNIDALDKILNEENEKGWELVQIFSTTAHGFSSKVYITLKRIRSFEKAPSL